MDILFIHGNYPGQFLHLSRKLAAQNRHRIYFLTNRENAEKILIPGVRIRKYRLHRNISDSIHAYLRPMEKAILNAQAVLRELIQLKNAGVTPRLIIVHGGNGLSLFIRHVFPSSKVILYLEWWFNKCSNKFLLADYSFNDELKSQMRNSISTLELDICDYAVTPTEWQLRQFPIHYHGKFSVIFDGIDTQFFYPHSVTSSLRLPVEYSNEYLDIKEESRVISYATRGMEPLRGFPEFIHLLPQLLNIYPDLQVVIAGSDRAAYSYPAPTSSGSWREYSINEIKNACDISRIHFTGLLPLQDYRNLLWRTNLHVYFSRPYVTSWGLFQAAACGCPLLINQGECISSFIKEETSSIYCDIDNPADISQRAIDALSDSKGILHKPKKVKIGESYSLKACLAAWQQFLNEILDS